jgi:hypothetical protein
MEAECIFLNIQNATPPAHFASVFFQQFLPRWPQTMILPISASRVAETTDLSHCTWPMHFLKMLQWLPNQKKEDTRYRKPSKGE